MDTPRGEALVPIGGRPPSLITLPGGCSFHPRCPYVRDSHRRTEPLLNPIEGDSGHQVACLLDSGTRKKIWAELAAGRDPSEARKQTLGDAPPAETVTAAEGNDNLADLMPSGGTATETAVASPDATTEGDAR
jgi:peptide/nickel transport system ATP-binding protein